MRILRFVLSAIMIVHLTGCDFAEQAKGMLVKQPKLQRLMEKEFGVNAFVGWNFHNGSLTNVTVQFPAKEIEAITVGEVSTKVLPIVLKAFGESPKQLTISFVLNP